MTGHRKSFVPLQSNPTVFTELIHKLGVSPLIAFHDVLSIDDAELLAFTPRPALALVLVLPTSTAYQDYKAKEDDSRQDYDASGEGEDVMWYKQTIHNACGLYGILHAVSNGEARGFIGRSLDFQVCQSYCVVLKNVGKVSTVSKTHLSILSENN